MRKLMKISVSLLLMILILFGLAGCMDTQNSYKPEPQMQETVGVIPTGTEAADETLPEEMERQKESHTRPTVEETVPEETVSIQQGAEKQTGGTQPPNTKVPDGTETTTGREETSSTEPQGTEPSAEIPPSTEPPKQEPESENSTPDNENDETESTEMTGPQKEQVDISAIEGYAETYAQSLGFVVDNSLGKGNAGYYSPDYRPLSSTQEGNNAATGLVSATKNQLNSRFSTEYCETLVEQAYGYARVNCLVEYSHTDELGDWYYIYVLYG